MLLNAKKYFYLLLILCIVLLSLSQYLRFRNNDGFFYGEESYYNLKIAEFIKENKAFPAEDSMSYGGRPYVGEYGYPLLLSLNIKIIPRILPILLGVFSFILFYFIITKIKFEIRGLASLILIISPTFIYLFSTLTKYSVVVFLSLFAILLHLNKKHKIALFLFIITGFFSFISSTLILIIYSIYGIFKKGKKFNLLIFFLSWIIIFFVQFFKVFKIGVPETIFGIIQFNINNIINIIFSDFGSIFGFSLFLFLMAIIGIYYINDNLLKTFIYYSVLIIFTVLTIYFNALIFLLVFLLAFFASYGIYSLFFVDWKSEIFKYLTIVILCCGLLFSIVAYMDGISKFTPTKDFADGLKFLKGQKINTVVFSDYSRGIYLNYADKKNFMDSNFLYAPGVSSRALDAERLFRTNNLNVALAIINKYNIEYIWIDKEILNKFWANEDRELLFLLRYSPQNFNKVFSNGDVEIYQYIPLNRR